MVCERLDTGTTLIVFWCPLHEEPQRISAYILYC